MDLFLTILRSVDGTKQAKTLGLKPEESKLSPIVPVTENPADIYWSNDNKAEKQQYQEPPNTGGYEEKVVFKDQQEPNQKESGLYGLDSQDFSLVNKDAPVKPNSVFDVVSKDKQIFNKKEEDHSKEHSLDFNKSEESERGFDPTSEKEDSNEIEKTTLKPEFELDQQHDDRRTDDEDDALIKINNDSNVENAGNSKEYVAILNPKLGTDFGSSQIDNEDTENVSDEVTVGPYIYTHNDTLSSSESNAPVSKENVSSDDSYATPVTENNNDFLEQPKEITDSEDVSKELTESTQPDEDKTPSEEVANAHKDHEFEIFGLEDSEETSKVGKSNKLSLLLTLLKGLPKDKRARILLLLKALKAKHTDGNHVESVDDITDANNSAAELESLLKGLKGEPKDKLAEILLHFMAKKKAHPKLLVKYKVALKSNGQTEANNDLSDQSGSDDSDSKNNDSDEEKRPKLHLKWNVHLKPTNDLKGLLFQIISKFNQLGISDEALQEINSDLDNALTENDDVSDCQSKVLNEKINEIKKGFQKLLKLRQEGDSDASSENDQ
ncbi:putative neugrin-like protein DDB_G0288135 [Ostrinia nubilalis]|uniref:putative neugrin-like protein DDB_G0288135 n=1 Tax=Ostrinia nubilalis TaxID=29057 RepID=UPI00308264F0